MPLSFWSTPRFKCFYKQYLNALCSYTVYIWNRLAEILSCTLLKTSRPIPTVCVLYEQLDAVLYLYGTNFKINGYLVLSDLLECCHGDANVIQVFDLPIQFLSCFINKNKDLLHLWAIFPVTEQSVVHHPVLGFSSEGHLQVRCYKEIHVSMKRSVMDWREVNFLFHVGVKFFKEDCNDAISTENR